MSYSYTSVCGTKIPAGSGLSVSVWALFDAEGLLVDEEIIVLDTLQSRKALKAHAEYLGASLRDASRVRTWVGGPYV